MYIYLFKSEVVRFFFKMKEEAADVISYVQQKLVFTSLERAKLLLFWVELVVGSLLSQWRLMVH